MARFLQEITCAAWSLGVAAAVLAVGPACGPIEPEKRTFRAPYIDPGSVQPERRVFQFVAGRPNDTQEFRVKPYDPNPEEELLAAWITGETFLNQQTLDRTSSGPTTLNGERYYEFNAAVQELDPCGLVESGENSVVVSVYIADRNFRDVRGSQVVVEQGGHLVERSWVVQPENCRSP